MKGVKNFISLNKFLIIGFLFIFLFSCTKTTYPSMYDVYFGYNQAYFSQKFNYPPIRPPYTKEAYPIRFQEEILPVWIPDYVTEDGVLVQGHYIWIVVRGSRWYIEGGPYLPPLEEKK